LNDILLLEFQNVLTLRFYVFFLLLSMFYYFIVVLVQRLAGL